VAEWSLPRMAMYNIERQIGDDGDSLTDMGEATPAELVTHSDTRCQRNVSYICEVLDQRTDLFKQFSDVRYQVQKMKIQPLFHDQAQRDISFRLAALNQVARFDTKAIHEITSVTQSKSYWSGPVRCGMAAEDKPGVDGRE
jgi:hypothetical protein